MNEMIKNLVTEWEKASIKMLTSKEFSVEQIEMLLRETYRVCTEYKDKDMVPKELCKIIEKIQWFMSRGVDAYHIDDMMMPSDTAEIDAILFILEEIQYGFYDNDYKYAFPNIEVTNSKNKPYILNLENEFLEFFIEENR